MENDIDFYLEKLQIPLVEFEKCVIDLTYDEEKFRIKYPMEKPIEIPITNQFYHDCQSMTITVMIICGKKYKKICRGKINLYKKYFMGDKTSHEKWIYLTLFQNQLEEMGRNSDIVKAELNKGKVYMKINVLNPVELRRKILMKDPIQANKTERYRSIVENSNEFLRKIKSGQAEDILEDLYEDISSEDEFDDHLSDLSISIIEITDDFKDVINLKELLNPKLIEQLQKYLNENEAEYIPNDYEKLLKMNENLKKNYLELKLKYDKTYNTLIDQNEELRKKAHDYYEEYKEMKKEVYKGRCILKEKKVNFSKDVKYNKNHTNIVIKNVKDCEKESDLLMKNLNMEPVNPKEEEPSDCEYLCSLLAKLDKLGFDVLNCPGYTDKDRKKVKKILEEEKKKNTEKEKIKIEKEEQKKKAEEEQKERDGDPEIMNKIIQETMINVFGDQNEKEDKVTAEMTDAFTFNFANKMQTISVKIKCEQGVAYIGSEKLEDWLRRMFA